MIIRFVNIRWVVLLFTLSLIFASLSASAAVLTTDTVWKGEVSVEEDILVPNGVTLTILPGAVLRIHPTDSTKTDPEYLSPLTEITVRGTLRAEGTAASPILFSMTEGEKPEGWAGIIIDGGTVVLRSCTIRNAETGVYALKGSATIDSSIVRDNRYGIVAQGAGTRVRMEKSEVRDNDYGTVLIGTTIDSGNSTVARNRKKDTYIAATKDTSPPVKEYRAEKAATTRTYGDAVLLGDTVWQGRIEVNGVIRIPEESRLLILPGTTVTFNKKDTNNDGIGENGLLIQGVLIAKGTRERPIIFRSAEQHRGIGDWDSINIMNSDGVQNLIEFCQIEDAYRGLHFHFSNVAIHDSVVRNNYRGVQFQESAVEMTDNHVYGSKSGVQGRDSQVFFTGNVLYRNYTGANFLRSAVFAKGNVVMNNIKEGMRFREGAPQTEENLINGNRYGLLVNDAQFGSFNHNVVAHNLESGMSLKGDNNLEIAGNFIHENGLNGVLIQDSSAVIRRNQISKNGERGIGVLSFYGSIEENSFSENGAYALGVDGASDVSAPRNWWGGGRAEQVIYDKNNDPAKGRVLYAPEKEAPVVFSWPLATVDSDTSWHGVVYLEHDVDVVPAAVLTVTPGTTVLFSKGRTLSVHGRIISSGKKSARITFTSAGREQDANWNELYLVQAQDSIISYSDFSRATWSIHSHFTNLVVSDSTFQNNYGGMRFTGGPLLVRHSQFEGNTIGIRAYKGRAEISENMIARNEIGIFVREKGGGLAINRNDLYDNSDYNIRVGDFNDEDVDARENYWGRGDPAETILDGRKEKGIGMVHYEPFSRKPCVADDRKVSK